MATRRQVIQSAALLGLVAPPAVEKRNFGTLEFSRQGGRRVATARCFDSRGEPLWTQVLATV